MELLWGSLAWPRSTKIEHIFFNAQVNVRWCVYFFPVRCLLYDVSGVCRRCQILCPGSLSIHESKNDVKEEQSGGDENGEGKKGRKIVIGSGEYYMLQISTIRGRLWEDVLNVPLFALSWALAYGCFPFVLFLVSICAFLFNSSGVNECVLYQRCRLVIHGWFIWFMMYTLLNLLLFLNRANTWHNMKPTHLPASITASMTILTIANTYGVQ